MGSAIATTDYVRLTPDHQSKQGAVWQIMVWVAVFTCFIFIQLKVIAGLGSRLVGLQSPSLKKVSIGCTQKRLTGVWKIVVPEVPSRFEWTEFCLIALTFFCGLSHCFYEVFMFFLWFMKILCFQSGLKNIINIQPNSKESLVQNTTPGMYCNISHQVLGNEL